ncbi:DinB family protein [Pseudoflavitalea sp. X16]|uniref:DinB family protein n=1 Tax=Paraflavitalea devenefica TaxID=2716334 RepID=UPI0014214996|nr:DinB family protein [Paraflavitalea devenefica]NII25193.1 DinB family protein [Paraflavitalea devenefica]
MASDKLPEVWLRGPLEGIPALLQPVAHALLQAQEEIHDRLQDFPESLLWEQPAGVASPGFHLQHIPGVLDRLFTYADGRMLSDEQLHYLSLEGKITEGVRLSSLLETLDVQVRQSITRLKTIDPDTLTAVRGVGRKQVPSTVLGLLFHSAEHTMRHTGQLLVTVQVLKAKQGE